MIINIPQQLQSILKELYAIDAKPIVVGGFVRDSLLSQPGKDIDIEIYNISSLKLIEPLLKPFGPVNAVGKSFGVLKIRLDDIEIDFSLPRTESKTGAGHKGFHVKHSGNLSFKEAASRRDFTINSIGWDPQSNELLDPFNGQSDLTDRVLRHVSHAFSEDPLRVLRGVQFSARFSLSMHPTTKDLCSQLDLTELPKERICDEWKKLLLKSEKPSIGLELIDELGLFQFFPELAPLKGCLQDPEWHPEGDVWDHTLMVVDEMAKLKTGDDKRDFMLMLSALCHDLGKPATTIFHEGRWRSPNHEAKGVPPTKLFLKRLTDEKDLIDSVCNLVREHLKPALLYNDNIKNKVSDSAIRRLALRVNLNDLHLVTQADHFGRTTQDALAREFPAGEWLMERAASLSVKDATPQPLLLGRHLITLGFSPGKKMGTLLKKAFDAQLDGKFTTEEDGLNWISKHYPAP